MEPLKANIEMSKQVFENGLDLINSGACYHNVFSTLPLIKRLYPSEEISIGYGYYGKENLFFVRHCYFLVSGQIVDPTSCLYKKLKTEEYVYYTFADVSLPDYFYTLHKNGGKLDLTRALANREKTFLQTIYEKGLIIVEDDYDKYLKKHDKKLLVHQMPNLMKRINQK